MKLEPLLDGLSFGEGPRWHGGQNCPRYELVFRPGLRSFSTPRVLKQPRESFAHFGVE